MAGTEDSLPALAGAALQDRNLHTDARLALRRRLIELLHAHGHEVERGGQPDRAQPPALGEVSALVNAALSDLDVRTDQQFAFTRKLQQLLKVAAART